NAVIEVQNASGRKGEETKAVDLFLDFGIAKGNLITSPAASETGQTQIIDFSGKAYTAQRIAGWMELPNARIRISTPEDAALRVDPRADIVVLLGSDANFESAQSR
ncbi:MAG TPA: LytR C-terminal domain-containing protein, partial [Dehalococcoidia bacterium]|nr:LytR C-terminal domain-containing protein [Dehalococcoidia bacterium]